MYPIGECSHSRSLQQRSAEGDSGTPSATRRRREVDSGRPQRRSEPLDAIGGCVAFSPFRHALGDVRGPRAAELEDPRPPSRGPKRPSSRVTCDPHLYPDARARSIHSQVLDFASFWLHWLVFSARPSKKPQNFGFSGSSCGEWGRFGEFEGFTTWLLGGFARSSWSRADEAAIPSDRAPCLSCPCWAWARCSMVA